MIQELQSYVKIKKIIRVIRAKRVTLAIITGWSYYRLLVHETAETLGLAHSSIGKGNNRHIVLKKIINFVLLFSVCVVALIIVWKFKQHSYYIPFKKIEKMCNLDDNVHCR